MANAIELAQMYVPILDEVYQNSSLTAVLDGDSKLAQQGANANEMIIPMMQMDGLGDYSRSGGYTSGDVSLKNETVDCNFDRGRLFTVDTMDDLETAGIAFGRLSGEFIRTKVVPELDAFRFACYAGKEGISKISAGTMLTTGEAVIEAISEGMAQMDDDEVPQEDRHLFITPTLLRYIQKMKTTESREVLEGFASVVKVPQSRFYTAIEQLDGKSEGEKKGGYRKAEGAADINFMILQKAAVIQFEKHIAPKIIPPEQNQTSDGYLFGYRNVGIADMYENKVAGVYLHYKPAQ